MFWIYLFSGSFTKPCTDYYNWGDFLRRSFPEKIMLNELDKDECRMLFQHSEKNQAIITMLTQRYYWHCENNEGKKQMESPKNVYFILCRWKGYVLMRGDTGVLTGSYLQTFLDIELFYLFLHPLFVSVHVSSTTRRYEKF